MHNIPNYSEVMNISGLTPPVGKSKWTDADLIVTCDQCGKRHKLSDAKTSIEYAALLYRCPSCPDLLAIVSPPVGPSGSMKKSGCVLIPEWIVAPIGKMELKNNTATKVVLDGCENALIRLIRDNAGK